MTSTGLGRIPKRRQRALAVARLEHRVALLAQHLGERPSDQRFIVDDQHAGVCGFFLA